MDIMHQGVTLLVSGISIMKLCLETLCLKNKDTETLGIEDEATRTLSLKYKDTETVVWKDMDTGTLLRIRTL